MKRIPLVLAGLLMPVMLQAQLPDPSTRALGMGGAYTSIARGYESVFWNPAMLAADGRPGFTIGLPHVEVEVGSNAYGFSDFKKYANSYLTTADKQTLMNKLASDSALTIRTLFGVEEFGLSIGPFALAVGSAFQGDLALGKDAVQLALFGNASRTAPGQYFSAKGSGGFGWAASTAAASFALHFPMLIGRLSVGITGKYTIGHFLASAGDIGSKIGPVNPAFSATTAGQAIYTNYAKGCNSFKPLGTDACGGEAGHGIGADLGGTLQLAKGGITLSAVLVNAIGSMTWDASRLVYERTVRSVTQDATGKVATVTTDSTRLTTPAAINTDPRARALRDSLLAHASFSKLARAGFALRSGMLTLAATAQVRLQQGLDQEPSQLMAAGAEYRVFGILPLRAGASTDFAGATTLSAGTGLQLFGINIDASIANISGTVHPGVRLGFGVGLIW
jgi:hypothetical protein